MNPHDPLAADTRGRADLIRVLFATVATFSLASALQVQERLTTWMQSFEHWQLDELPLALTSLSIGLAWYAWRRRREADALLARNRELAQRLMRVQDEERRALARDLHDELGQHCTALRIESTVMSRSTDPVQVAAAARRAAESAEHLHAGVRGMLKRLRPAELDELGLAAALRALCDACRARSGLRCGADLPTELPPLGEELHNALYRVAQEGLNNVERHARATCAELRLTIEPDAVVLEVLDDGRGIPAMSRPHGLGLLGVAERAAALGGQVAVHRLPGAGTALRLTLPRLARADQPVAADNRSPLTVATQGAAA